MTALSFLLRLLILAGVVFMLWWAFRPRPDFTITVKNREVRIRGRFPKAGQKVIQYYTRATAEVGNHFRLTKLKSLHQ